PLRRRAEDLLQLSERLRAPADPLEWRDLAVVEGENRLHGEELPREARRLPDPTAANQILERVHREKEPALAVEALDERVDLLVVRAAIEPPLDRVGEDHRAARGHLRVDDAHLAAEVLRRQVGAR